jgi:NAD(P)-dependent dehydrogenase (short-subunit alcohol dehydrogenase family)
MREFAGKVAVITGAASGIGRGLVEQCATEGMSVVLADVNRDALAALGSELETRGVKHLLVPTDVASAEAVEALAAQSFLEFGRVDLLFNNAGVLLSGYSWERTAEDWEWILGINVMGVVHGIRSFVPRLLAQGSEAHIVNTASLAAMLSAPLMGPYTVSKCAVRGLTETLHFEMQALQAPINVSLLCPGQVATAIVDSGRARKHDAVADGGKGDATLKEFLSSGIDAGMAPAKLAAIVFQAIREQRFWIFPHPDFKAAYESITAAMLAEQNPVYDPLLLDGGGDT